MQTRLVVALVLVVPLLASAESPAVSLAPAALTSPVPEAERGPSIGALVLAGAASGAIGLVADGYIITTNDGSLGGALAATVVTPMTSLAAAYASSLVWAAAFRSDPGCLLDGGCLSKSEAPAVVLSMLLRVGASVLLSSQSGHQAAFLVPAALGMAAEVVALQADR